MSKVFFQEEFQSTYEAMAQVLDRAVDALLENGWVQPGREHCARLCLEEALVNAVHHGNEDQPERKVGLEMLAENDMCTIKVCDEGDGFHPEEVHLPGCDELGGRGIVLIRHYMDHVEYCEKDHCLEMTLRRQTPKEHHE